VLVIISSMSVPICNNSHARRVSSCKITTFQMGTPLWRWPAQLVFLELRGSGLRLLRSMFNAKKIRAHVVLVYLQPFQRNTLKMCVAPKIVKNSLKPLILGVRSRSRLSMLIQLKSSPWVLVMISSMSVPIHSRFHSTRANSGKTRTYYRVYPSFTPLFEGNFTQGHEISSR